MPSIIQQPPRTLMDVFRILPEGTLAELIDNRIYTSPSPFTLHQKTVFALAFEIETFLRKTKIGSVYQSPLDVYLDETRNAVQPDVFVVLNGNSHIVQHNGHVHGTPDLVIEILSPGNKDHDRVTKKNLYEQFGVKEYFIADPETKEVIHYLLENNKFIPQPASKGELNCRLLNCLFRW